MGVDELPGPDGFRHLKAIEGDADNAREMAGRLEREAASRGGQGEAFEVEQALAPRCPSLPAEPDRARSRLELCPRCHRDLVYPLDWAPAGERRWRVALRCPECEWQGAGVHSQDVVDRFDEALDDGTQELLDDLEALTRANLEGEIDRLADALQRDLVLPEDF